MRNRQFKWLLAATLFLASNLACSQGLVNKECIPAAGKVPPWVEEPSSSARQTLEAAWWYQDWLQSTTSLCTDLTRLEKDNPNIRIVWRDDQNALFRGGSGRQVTEIFDRGFYPWKANGNLVLKTGFNNQESALTNTGYNPSYTFEFGINSADKGQGYIIDAPGGINKDTSDSEGGALLIRNVVVFPGGIRADRIKAAFFMNAENKLTFVFNHNYYGGIEPFNEEFDLVTSVWSERNSVRKDAHIDVSPKGRPIGKIAQRYRKGTDINFTLIKGDTEECWFVNGEQKNRGTAFTLRGDEQLQSMEIVYRGPCDQGTLK